MKLYTFVLTATLTATMSFQIFGMDKLPLKVDGMEDLRAPRRHFHATSQRSGQFISAAGRFGHETNVKRWITTIALCKQNSASDCHCQWTLKSGQNVSNDAKARAITAMNMALYNEGCRTITYLTGDMDPLAKTVTEEVDIKVSGPSTRFQNASTRKVERNFPDDREVTFENAHTVFDS